MKAFKPMVYCVDDPIGEAAGRCRRGGHLMPLGAPIGSGCGTPEPGDDPADRRGANEPRAGRCRCRHSADAAVGDETWAVTAC